MFGHSIGFIPTHPIIWALIVYLRKIKNNWNTFYSQLKVD